MEIILGRKRTLILAGCIIFFAALYTLQVVVNHYLMRTYGLDYGFYNQAFWDFAHFRVNANTVMEPPLNNYFQIHSGITLLLLSPLYWLFTPFFGTYSLLIIQNIFIVAGGYAVYRLILRKTENYWIAILAFVHYNLLWGHYGTLSFDFSETAMGASMVPFFLLYFDKKKYAVATVFYLFFITSKENMPVWFVFISALLLLSYKERKARIWALSLGLFSMIYFIFIFKIFIPYFEDPSIPYWGFAYSALGKNPGEAIHFIFLHPFEAIKFLFVNHLGDPEYNGIKREFYVVFLLSGGIFLFLRPHYILPFLPLIAQKMYNDAFTRWGISGYYSIEIASILTLYSFLAIDRLRHSKVKLYIIVFLCAVTGLVTLIKMNSRTALWHDRSKEAIYSPDFYKSPLDVGKIRRQIHEFVPEDSSVVASQNIVPQLAFRSNARIFPYVHDARYIILLKVGNTYPLYREDFEKVMQRYLDDPEWEKLLDDYPLLILRRK